MVDGQRIASGEKGPLGGTSRVEQGEEHVGRDRGSGDDPHSRLASPWTTLASSRPVHLHGPPWLLRGQRIASGEKGPFGGTSRVEQGEEHVGRDRGSGEDPYSCLASPWTTLASSRPVHLHSFHENR